MTVREQIIEDYAQWTVLSALRVGSPIRSRVAVYATVRAVDFGPLFEGALGPIDQTEFDNWHRSTNDAMRQRDPKLTVGWASKMLNVYLKTRGYVAAQGRTGLSDVLHPPIDAGLWLGLRRRFRQRPDILADTHCVQQIADIREYDCYERIIRGCRAAADLLDCRLIEVEQLWAGTEIPRRRFDSRGYLDASADIDGPYRYELTRRLAPGNRTVLFIGLNPSNATAVKDDATVIREVDFARRWAFDRYVKGNLHAYVSPDPGDLARVSDPVGPRNRETLERLVGDAEVIVAAWGATPLDSRGRAIADWISALPQTHCLGFTKDGCPKHPGRIAKSTPLQPMHP
jgi:hypothetical protein